MKNNPIGIFDSGVGGLTVLREIEKILPHENIVYLGDTARVPYGNKSKSTIIKFSTENTLFLLKKKVKMVVVACNTVSSLALGVLRRRFNLPILGVIAAGAKKAVRVSKKKKIGVIGTRSTIKSKSYEKEISKISKNTKVYTKACPLFVPLVEEAVLSGEITEDVIKMYLGGLKKRRIDTIILGCTHYPILERKISNFLKGVTVINSAKEITFQIKKVLSEKNLLNKKNKKGKIEFYLTDQPQEFIKLARVFLKRRISKPKMVNV